MKSASFPASLSHLDRALIFIDEHIKEIDRDNIKQNEIELICEELLLKLIEAGKKDAEVQIRLGRQGQDIKIRFECPGDPLFLEANGNEDIGGKILSGYADKIRQSYRNDCNIVEVLLWTSENRRLHINLLMALIGAVLGTILHYFFYDSSNFTSLDNLLFSPTYAYLNIFRMLSPLAAFFTLAYSISEFINKTGNSVKTARLAKHYALTSLVCVIWGMVAGELINHFVMTPLEEVPYGSYTSIIGGSLIELLRNLTASNILDLFTQDNPLPMLLVAIIFGLTAANMFGVFGTGIKKALGTVSEFMCNTLHLVYYVFPIILLFTVANMALTYGLLTIPVILLYITLSILTLAVVLLFYAASLCRYKIRLKDFWSDYKDIIKTNFQIASNKDAFFYNKRVIRKKTSLNDAELTDALRLGIMMNMDGSSVMIAMIMISLFSLHSLSIPETIEIIALIILLSLGTPNQPGSLFVAPVILFTLFNLDQAYFNLLIVAEAFTGKYYSFINSLGDIVSIAIIDNRFGTQSPARKKVATKFRDA